MTVVDGFKTKVIGEWAKRHLASGSAVISDGLACFKAVKEANCEHQGVVTGSNLDLLDHLGKYDDRECEKLTTGQLS